MEINDENQRFYFVETAVDSIILNEHVIHVDSAIESPFYGYNYLLSVDSDGSLNFIEKIKYDGKLALTENSIFVFLAFGEDTLFVGDTIFIKNETWSRRNMVAIEYDFAGNRLRSKQYSSSADNCIFRINEVKHDGNNFYVAGDFQFDTLYFDDQVTSSYEDTFYDEVYIAKINEELDCEWIQTIAGLTSDFLADIDLDAENQVFSTGSYSSSNLYCGQDTIFNPFGWFWPNMFIAKHDAEGNCVWLRGITDPGSVSAVGIHRLADESFVVAGRHQANTDFGGTILTNPNEFSNAFIAKYSVNGDFKFATQLGEGNGVQDINDMATTPTSGIWIVGGYESDTLKIGDFNLPRIGSVKDAFIAKYDKYGLPMYANAFGGADAIAGSYWIRTGNDNRLYALAQTSGDSMVIDGISYHFPNTIKAALILEIKDEITDTKETINQNIELNIYPNPLNGNILNYEFSGEPIFEKYKVEIFSTYGQLMGTYEISGNKGSVDLPPLAPGIYFLKLEDEKGEGYVVRKIIKQ